jgi:hypothetical protein
VRVNPIDGAALRDAIGGNHAKPFKPVLKHRSPKAIIADRCLLSETRCHRPARLSISLNTLHLTT